LGRLRGLRNIDVGGFLLRRVLLTVISTLKAPLSPRQFCAAVLPHGTSAVVADPHEIANVLGLDGIRYFLAAAESLPLDLYFNLPSCVPACPLETSGARLRAADLHAILPHPKVLGLAEMMNFPGVIHAVPEVLDKLLLFQEHVLGHAPMLSGMDLNAYLVSGIARITNAPPSRKHAKNWRRHGHIMIEGSHSKIWRPRR
jgi:adenine deaminase